MKPKEHTRMYHRQGRGWYADYRNYAREGGGLEALIPEGARRATEDHAQATLLYARRLQELKDLRSGKIQPADPIEMPKFGEFLEEHLTRKAKRVRPQTVAQDRKRLQDIRDRGWRDLPLVRITGRLVNRLIADLEDDGLASQTVNHYVSSLAACLRDAVVDGYLPANPAHGVARPRVDREPGRWLESEEGYRLLVAAAEVDRIEGYSGLRVMEPLVAAALLTGGRRDELFALQVEDVDFDGAWVHFRPNRYYPRRKSKYATRTVPLWAQLRKVLLRYIGDRRRGLLFPGAKGGPIHDARGSLDVVFGRGSVVRPAGRAWHLFRHTYTAMRLQTLDNGAPVSLFTVARELGHGSVALIEQTYGHLLKQRAGQRLDRVEYRPLKIAREKTA
jgi:integrase